MICQGLAGAGVRFRIKASFYGRRALLPPKAPRPWGRVKREIPRQPRPGAELKLQAMSIEIAVLTPEQKAYLNSWQEGT